MSLLSILYICNMVALTWVLQFAVFCSCISLRVNKLLSSKENLCLHFFKESVRVIIEKHAPCGPWVCENMPDLLTDPTSFRAANFICKVGQKMDCFWELISLQQLMRERQVINQKCQNFVQKKRKTCMSVHLNILCLSCINLGSVI